MKIKKMIATTMIGGAVLNFSSCEMEKEEFMKQIRAEIAAENQKIKDELSSELSLGNNGYGETDGHKWVDLGLPSGTKWATCNFGAESPTDFGLMYRWGELGEGIKYNYGDRDFIENEIPFVKKNEEEYKNIIRTEIQDFSLDRFGFRDSYFMHFDGSYEGRKIINMDSLVYYNFLPTQAKKYFENGLETLQDEDNIVKQKWGKNWDFPTKEQVEELFENCVRGIPSESSSYQFFSKINSNYIFFYGLNHFTKNTNIVFTSYKIGENRDRFNSVFARFFIRPVCNIDNKK